MTEEITLNGKTYVEKKAYSGRSIVRCRNAGVWVGKVEKRNQVDTILTNANRIWRWRGALTLSEMSRTGVNRDQHTRIAEMVDIVTLTTSDTCEIISVADGVDLTAVWHE